MSSVRVWRLVVSCCALTAAQSVLAQVFEGTLSGGNEAPPNASAGSGSVVLVLDGDLLAIDARFSGLDGLTTQAHIHCCTPPGSNVGVAVQSPSFSAFPVGVSQGQHLQVLDLSQLSNYSASFVANNGGTMEFVRAALLAGLNDGLAYYNIHTAAFPGGELRADLLRLDLFADDFESD